MKIDPNHLRTLRQQKRLTRPQLADRSGITVRTIQRLEREPHRSQKTREDTLNRLAKALSVEPDVLTGDLPLPEFDKSPVSDPAPKVRLAFDLIKRRYGVSRTEIINMAPLFFALLAEGSLAWRREKLEEGAGHLQQIEFGHGVFGSALTVADMAMSEEEGSINKNDLFGEHLLEQDVIGGWPFDPDEDNPFVYYLHKLVNDLDIPGVVDVDSGDLCFGSPPKFPDYDICCEELDCIANGSPDARRALETGHARFAEIPEELMAEDAGEARAKWLKDKLPGIYKALGEAGDLLADRVAVTSDENRKLVEKVDSQKINSETEKEEDDQ